MSGVNLILKDIKDPHIRENFFRLANFLNGQVLFDGEFQLFEVEIPRAASNFEVRHGLPFIPQDIVTLGVEGDHNFYFRFQEFTRDSIFITAEGPCRLRFLAGKLSDLLGTVRQDEYPLVPPSSGSSGPPPGGAVWEIIDVTLPASSTTVADTFALSTMCHVDYILNMKATTTSRAKSLKMSCVKDDTTLRDTVYARVGAALDVDVTAAINGVDFELQCTNNEAYAIDLRLAKLLL